MADIEQLYDALRKADAAGNAGDAQRLADAIREAQPKRTPKQMTTMDTIRAKALDVAGFVAGGGPVGRLGRQGSAELDTASEQAGGAATDFASKYLKTSPYEAGAIGAGTQLTLQAIPAMATGLGGSRVAGKALADISKGAAEWTMGWSLAPTTKQWLSGEGPAAVKKMLDSNLNVSTKGIAALKDELAGYWKGVDKIIGNSKETVPRGLVEQKIRESLDVFKGGPEEQASINAIKGALREFRETPSLRKLHDLPMDVAQRYKKLIYKKLDDSYGMISSPDKEAWKGAGRAFKEGIEAKHPEVAGLNAKEQEIYKTLPVLERKAMQSLSANPQHLAFLAHNPPAAAAVVLGRTPAFTSWLANRMNQFSKGALPEATGGAAGVSLYEIGKNVDERPANR